MFWISLLVIFSTLVGYGRGAEIEGEASCVYPLLENGYLMHADDIFRPDQGTVYVGSLMTPICEGMPGEKLVLVGSGSLVCNDKGTWTPNPFPECYVAKAGCALTSFENGVIRLGSSDAQFISFKCNAGFRLVGAETLSCGLDDARGPGSGHQWTKPVPYCEEIPPTTTPLPTTTPEPTTTTPIPTTPRILMKPYKVLDGQGYCHGASKYWTVWHICDCNLTCTYMVYVTVILCVPLAVIVCLAPLLYRARNSKPSNNVSVRPNALKFVKSVKLAKLSQSEEEQPTQTDDYLVPVTVGGETRYGQQPAGGGTGQGTFLKESHDYEDCV